MFLVVGGASLAGLLAFGQAPARTIPPSNPTFRFLVDDPRFVYSRPCVSPSGDRVVYMRAPATADPIAAENANLSPWTLWTAPWGGGESTLLFGDPDVRATRPDWSAASNRVAFTGITHDGEAALWILDPETGAGTRVRLDGPPRDRLFYPTWFPDGDRIALTDYRSHTLLEVWVDTGNVRPLTAPGTVLVGMASIAPDRGPMPRIAFAGQRPGGTYSVSENRIWIRLPNGGLRLLNGKHGRTPAWSPRGDELAFSSVRARPHPSPVMRPLLLPPAAMGIYVQRLDRQGVSIGSPRAVSPPDHAAVHPKWHPSGRLLVCTMHSLVSNRRGVAVLQLET